MKNAVVIIFTILLSESIYSQNIDYEISFKNAAHHEAEITIEYTNVQKGPFSVRMSRTSPGRYALHEFAKNVYGFNAFDSKGRKLQVRRPNNHEWVLLDHDGSISIKYILFANRGDGTYAQIDETHAHLNIPATFMYAPSLAQHEIQVKFNLREDLGWKVATQLPWVEGSTYTAPNLQYFMDSPTELSNFSLREFKIDSKTIQLALHHMGTEEEVDLYFEKVKKVVLAEKEVFGVLPKFDYDTYTFLACYIENASGDGMEHRNSTVLTSTRSLSDGGMEKNIGTVSHEFFHAWNVERIRPASLEPFNFEAANMSGELWFAEGFTSYYTNLILCRAGLISTKAYIEGLSGTFNYVWNSPGTEYFNPIEMSYQAPFVDAATSVDPVNRENTFISYYSYGSVLGLALDLALRQENLNLDDYFKYVWNTYGKDEIPYTINDLHTSLNTYAGKEFGNRFFNNYIYKSGMPDYKTLFKHVGVSIDRSKESPYFGASVRINNGQAILLRTTVKGSPAYLAGLEKGDTLSHINGLEFEEGQKFKDVIQSHVVGDSLKVQFIRHGTPRNTTVVLGKSPVYTIKVNDKASAQALQNRYKWLKVK